MRDQNSWEHLVKGLLKSELKRCDVTYAQLAARLQGMGIAETEANIRNKLSRGKFTAIFFVQCLTAAGVSTVRLTDE